MNRSNILSIEWFKLRHSSSWWIMLALYVAVILLALANLNALVGNADVMIQGLPQMDFSFKKIMRFPQIWHNLTYLAGFFKIIPALIVITSVSQEFLHRTARQNIIDGLSRQEFMVGKLFVVFLLTSITIAFVFGLGMFFGITNADPEEAAGPSAEMVFLAAYTVEFFTYMCYALLLAVLVKRPAVALVLLLAIDIMIEPFVGLFLGPGLKAYLPFMVIDDLIRFPLMDMIAQTTETGVQLQKMLVALGYGAVAYVLAVLRLKSINL